MTNINYYNKYLKYKFKYNNLLIGSGIESDNQITPYIPLYLESTKHFDLNPNDYDFLKELPTVNSKVFADVNNNISYIEKINDYYYIKYKNNFETYLSSNLKSLECENLIDIYSNNFPSTDKYKIYPCEHDISLEDIKKSINEYHQLINSTIKCPECNKTILNICMKDNNFYLIPI